MIRFDDLTLFTRVVALGNFTRAAREADLLPGQVSTAIQRLERELDVRLFARSTRSLRLTVEGEQYLPFARDVIATLEEGRERLNSDRNELRGVLQIAAPSDLGRNVMLPWLTEFRQTHPLLSVRLHLSDCVTDIYQDPIDIAIRYGLVEDASYICMPLAPDNRRVLVASPSYLDMHGRPEKIEDLQNHQCLLFLLGGRPNDRWSFQDGASWRKVKVKGNYLCDDADIAHRWAVAGQGIAYKSWIDVCGDVSSGRLEVLLPDQPGELTPLHFICPHRKQFLPAVRLLHTFLQEKCAGHLSSKPPVKDILTETRAFA
ncbi:LysR family transcriptional regulator [Burkholderia ubonensis]|uniref:LysR family transcriptional regulator n=1 Tax=Burkholderia ubonensis TaxID=101571 RepID=UPI00075E0A85|nr:LysR family transcriptional regulator [Burkholderia ubonensis]KVN86768.1 LysR family transcriptional regulator [Burkholderia ubonensis]